ncbi:MAG: PepSY domain-containing protein [Geminicoccaceae bacterium]
MKARVIAGAAGLIVLGGVAFAAEPEIGSKLGTTYDEVAAALGENGYRIHEFEREGSVIEIEAARENERREFKLDARTGEIIRIEHKS